MPRLLWLWCLQALPLRLLLFCLQIVVVNRNFAARDDPREGSWVVSHHTKSTRQDSAASDRVSTTGEQNSAEHVQVFCEDLWQIHDSNVVNELIDSSWWSLRVSSRICFFHIFWRFAGDWSPWTLVSWTDTCPSFFFFFWHVTLKPVFYLKMVEKTFRCVSVGDFPSVTQSLMHARRLNLSAIVTIPEESYNKVTHPRVQSEHL